MRYSRLWLITIGLALSACGSTPVGIEPASVPETATAIQMPQPTSTAPPATPGPATAEATPTAERETPTPEPTLPMVTSTVAPTPVVLTGTFVKGEVPVSGSYTLDVASYTLTLSDDFKTVAGPDLYVILSGVGDVSLDFHTFSAQVVEAPLLYLGPLISTAGAQTYTIPEGTGLAVYQSVVIWCGAFSVEFAAAPLRP